MLLSYIEIKFMTLWTKPLVVNAKVECAKWYKNIFGLNKLLVLPVQSVLVDSHRSHSVPSQGPFVEAGNASQPADWLRASDWGC